jgi:hypothetical protein
MKLNYIKWTISELNLLQNCSRNKILNLFLNYYFHSFYLKYSEISFKSKNKNYFPF